VPQLAVGGIRAARDPACRRGGSAQPCVNNNRHLGYRRHALARARTRGPGERPSPRSLLRVSLSRASPSRTDAGVAAPPIGFIGTVQAVEVSKLVSPRSPDAARPPFARRELAQEPPCGDRKPRRGAPVTQMTVTVNGQSLVTQPMPYRTTSTNLEVPSPSGQMLLARSSDGAGSPEGSRYEKRARAARCPYGRAATPGGHPGTAGNARRPRAVGIMVHAA